MAKYRVIPSPKLDRMLLRHIEFLSRVSIPAARRFRQEFGDIVKRLSENPYQFPLYDDPNFPPDVYRKAIFAKWYQAVFSVVDDTVYLDAVVDGRSEMR